MKSPIITRSISAAKGVLAFAAHGMDRNLAAQIVRQPIDALADPRIFIPMSQQHSRVALQGEVVAAVPGDRLVVARVRLLRCGSGLPGILIDLCLPSFGCRRADGRVSLAQHVAADQLCRQGARRHCRPRRSSSRRRRNCGDGAFDPSSRLGQRSQHLSSIVRSEATTTPKVPAPAGCRAGCCTKAAPWS